MRAAVESNDLGVNLMAQTRADERRLSTIMMATFMAKV
jgi:hypothetical protein